MVKQKVLNCIHIKHLYKDIPGKFLLLIVWRMADQAPRCKRDVTWWSKQVTTHELQGGVTLQVGSWQQALFYGGTSMVIPQWLFSLSFGVPINLFIAPMVLKLTSIVIHLSNYEIMIHSRKSKSSRNKYTRQWIRFFFQNKYLA